MHLFNPKHPKDQEGALDGPKGFFHRIGRDPYLDWAIIFTVTVIIAIIMIFLGFLTFEGAIARLSESPAPTESASVRFDARALAGLLSTFDSRAAEHGKLLKAYDGPGDPSI